MNLAEVESRRVVLTRKIIRADKLIRREDAKHERWGNEYRSRGEMCPEWMKQRYLRACVNVRRLLAAKRTLLDTLRRTR